ncbi:cell division protein PerM [Microbacterium sp. No. 7]|uniref:cell division protein PerM n=1 Tax=Microbacterium sp. No. 7 TaxID=1714373 RepID=UPI0006D0BB0E|nr:DUF6350 family protein [Microbacterium sp. No. 7]ALJ19177.1 hypothetical protein AOA12_04370 [Microbacterium sp. No. 7]
MNRLLVLLLAAFDAVLAVVVGIALALAPLALLWVFAFGAHADWLALWPAAVRLWQLGNLVPLHLELPDEYLAAAAIPAEGAAFTLSLAPTAFAVLSAVLGARSGRRAAQAGEWAAGVAGATVAAAVLAAVLLVASPGPVASVDPAWAIVLPTVVFAVPALVSALVVAWPGAGGSALARASAAIPARFAGVPAAIARGTGAALAGVAGTASVLFAVALALRGNEIIGLYEASGADLTGAVAIAAGQLAYVPTLIVWAASYLAGPGFAFGAGTAIMPAGTSAGVVPGIPVLGVLPPGGSPWLLALVLVPVAVGALAGLVARRALAAGTDADGIVPRALALAGLIVLTAAAAFAAAFAASGSIGPGAMSEVGPVPWLFAVVLAGEIGVGAAIMLFAPRSVPDEAPAVYDDRAAERA